MHYLLQIDIFDKMIKNRDFVKMNGKTYQEYIDNNISLSEILSQLIYESDSSEDALEILKFFKINFTHDYLSYLYNPNNITLKINNIKT